jgi:ABC-type nitrate/sulfonate/bicarbonate transport system substrate-binding protein
VTKPSITDPKQIKSIGFVPGSVSEYATERMFAKFGIDPKSVNLVRIGPPEAPALLARGDLDGYFMWEPWPSNRRQATRQDSADGRRRRFCRQYVARRRWRMVREP